MNLEKRNELINGFFLNTCMPILGAKGAEYETPYEEANKNFSSLAELLNESKYQVWAVLFLKHVVAVLNEIEKHPHNPVSNGDCETLDEKIADIVNYALIFKTMLVEDEEAANEQILNVDIVEVKSLFQELRKLIG